MTKGRDDFDKPVVDALAKRAAFICSNPDCMTLTIAPSSEDARKFIYIGKAAHITAAAEGGPRFDSMMSSAERKSIDNGIFLCSNCADMIDKNMGADFSIKLLKEWKSTHLDLEDGRVWCCDVRCCASWRLPAASRAMVYYGTLWSISCQRNVVNLLAILAVML